MKKRFILFVVIAFLSSCCALAASYKVNSSGVVKNGGKIIPSPSYSINQNYYNNYNVNNYISTQQVNAIPVDIIEFVMDYSGSMSNWIEIAKRSMSSIVAQVPESVNLGFRVFGHNNYGNNPTSTLQEVKNIVKKGKKMKVVTQQGPIGSSSGVCAATQQVAPVSGANAQTILRGMNSVNIGGATPLVYALDRAVYQDFAKFDTVSAKKIVLITDGGENCGGDPCEFVRRLMAKRSDVHIDVVLVSSYSKSLNCLATETGGHIYTINNLSDFSTVINNSIQSKPTGIQNPIQQQEQNFEFINTNTNY